MIRDLKIGEKFKLDGVTYQVNRGGTCNECAFYKNDCLKLEDKIPECIGYLRLDKEIVNFKRIGGKRNENSDF